jgi:Tol biopolymer transport system component/alpha-tubulin suppressor-like RCC1 family protein
MRRLLQLSLPVLLTVAPQACQRNEATAPQFARPTAALAGVFKVSIAFTSYRDGAPGIYVMTPDGSGVTRLANGSDPTWSPDASQLAFTDFAGDHLQIFVMNADGSARSRLTNSSGHEIEPSWSPDGRQIAFVSSRDGSAEIYVMNVDGSAVTRLTNNSALDREPIWSSDGRQIAFTSNRDGNDEIYVMNADGSSQRRLTNNPDTDGSPTWSPDARRIAFESSTDFNCDIYVMNVDGSAPTRLTNGASIELEPSWSPDGRQIAFMSYRDGNHEIYVMNADGSAPTRLTDNPAMDQGPTWSPKIPGRSPARLAFTTQPPAGAWANAAISPAVQVTVKDESGDLVPGGNVRLAIGTSPAPGATISGTTSALIVNGVATFSDVRIDHLGRGYTLLAETGSHVSGTSAPFTIVEPATHLAFVTQPPATVDGGAAITVRVAIQDTLGNTLTSASAPVTFALAAHPTGVTIATTTVETVDGIATFSDVHVDQLGSGYRFQVAAPGRAGATSTPFAVHVTFASVDAGTRESCGVTTQGAGYCWGNNEWGSIGSGKGGWFSGPTNDPMWWPSPVPVVGGLVFTTISVGGAHTCGVTANGAGYCWGFGYNGQRGDGRSDTGGRTANTPRAVLGGLSFATISAGNGHTCGVTTGGAAYCWGAGGGGALGTGRPNFYQSTPGAVTGGLTFTAVSAGSEYTCGLTSDGAAYCWGVNDFGQVGSGGTAYYEFSPVPVAGGLTFATISAGSRHTCGLTADGTAYCWGDNTKGQLGDGTTTRQATPVAVVGGVRFATIEAGGGHTCGLTASGDAYCWGWNDSGQLGDGTTVDRSVPTPVSGGLTFTTIRAGGDHSCGMTTSGDAYCWGGNTRGQLGDGTQSPSPTPVPAAGTPRSTTSAMGVAP